MIWRLFVALLSVIAIGFSFQSTEKPRADFQTKREVACYSQHTDLQWNWALSSLKMYHFAGDEAVLDIGSGDGKITAQLAASVPNGKVIGLDVSPKMIDFASRHYPQKEYPNLLFIAGDVVQNPVHEQFDLVVSFCSAHFIQDQNALLNVIADNLKSGGKALLVMPESYSHNLSTVSEKLAREERWSPFFERMEVPVRYYKSLQEYHEMLQGVKLQVLSITSSMVDDTFKSRDALCAWIASISSFAKALPPEHREQFVEEVATLMLTECPAAREDGSLILRSPKLEIWLEKPVNLVSGLTSGH